MRAILLSGAFALFVSLLGTRVAINQFRKWGLGQQIRDDGPTSHHTKMGTPTMGGLVIVLATLVGYFGAKLITMSAPTASALLLLFLFVGLAAVGFLDDYIKIVKQRSLGLRAKAKMAGQLIVGIAFAILSLQFADARGQTPASDKLSFITDFGWSIGPVLGWGFGLAMHGISVFVLGKGSGVRERMVQRERERLLRQQQDRRP